MYFILGILILFIIGGRILVEKNNTKSEEQKRAVEKNIYNEHIKSLMEFSDQSLEKEFNYYSEDTALYIEKNIGVPATTNMCLMVRLLDNNLILSNAVTEGLVTPFFDRTPKSRQDIINFQNFLKFIVWYQDSINNNLKINIEFMFVSPEYIYTYDIDSKATPAKTVAKEWERDGEKVSLGVVYIKGTMGKGLGVPRYPGGKRIISGLSTDKKWHR